LEVHAIRSVLAQRALTLVGQVEDGRDVDPLVLARLEELAELAGALGLTEDRDRLTKLVNVARKGHTKNLSHAALKILTEFPK